MKINDLKFTIFIVSVCTLFIDYSAQAQTEFGVKGGVLLSGLNKGYSGTLVDFEKRTGYTAGVFFKNQNLLGLVGLQTELLYQLKGGNVYFLYHREEDSYSSGGYSSEFGYFNPATAPWLRRHDKYHYLNLSFLFSFSPFNFLDVYAGPEAGYLLSPSKAGIGINKPSRLSAAVTAGLSLKISDTTKLDFRYSEDLTRLNDFGDFNIKNYGFFIGLQRSLFRSKD